MIRRLTNLAIVAMLLGGLLGCGWALFGCASGSDGVRQGVANAAVVVAAGYKALNTYDEAKQTAAVARARGGDPEGAYAEIEEYVPKRDKALKALDNATAVVESAAAALPLIDAGVAQSKDVSDWIAKLLAAALQVRDALAGAGITLDLEIPKKPTSYLNLAPWIVPGVGKTAGLALAFGGAR